MDRRGFGLIGGIIGLALVLIGFVFVLGVIGSFIPFGTNPFPLIVPWQLQLVAAFITMGLGIAIAWFV